MTGATNVGDPTTPWSTASIPENLQSPVGRTIGLLLYGLLHAHSTFGKQPTTNHHMLVTSQLKTAPSNPTIIQHELDLTESDEH